MDGVIRVKREVLERLLAEARRDSALECCGLLAGRDGVVTTVLAATNVAASVTAYEIAPEELFRLFRRMRAAGLEHLGVYHSHPAGDNSPSPRDLERAFYPGVAYLIASPLAPEKPIRAFSIRDGSSTELHIVEV